MKSAMSKRPSWASETTSLTTRRPRCLSVRRNPVQRGSASEGPMSMPSTIDGQEAIDPSPEACGSGDPHGRLPQIVACDNRLHRRPHSRRAFRPKGRRAGFGPFGSRVPGFTLRRHPKGQLQLVLLPLGRHETSRPTHHFQRSGLRPTEIGLLCPLLTSAPRSPASRRAQSRGRDTVQISRGKLDRLPRSPAESTVPGP